jgi:hypothetical protein
MDDIINKIYDQVMDEACANPLRRFAELIRQDEREECAKICEDLFMADGDWCAKAIRARGEK